MSVPGRVGVNSYALEACVLTVVHGEGLALGGVVECVHELHGVGEVLVVLVGWS